MKESHDYDFIVIGSGFGGSVSACRLSEKGYKVAVLEMGKRWKPEDFPKTNWNLKRYFWTPLFRCFGFFPFEPLPSCMGFERSGCGWRFPGLRECPVGT